MFTAMIIAALIVAGAATAVGGVLVWASGRRELSAGRPPPLALGAAGGAAAGAGGAAERGLGDLRTGDVVQHGGIDFLVEGVLRYDEDGHTWLAGRLVDGADERWLVVGMERVGAAALRLCAIDPSVEVGGYPPDALTVGGVRYRQVKRGTASAQPAGDVGAIATSETPGSVVRCRWWRYEGTGGHGLIVEQWGSAFRALVGPALAESDLELMPGS